MSSRFPACVDLGPPLLIALFLVLLPGGQTRASTASPGATDHGIESEDDPEATQTAEIDDPRAAVLQEVSSPESSERARSGRRGRRGGGGERLSSEALDPLEAALKRLAQLDVEVRNLERSRDELRGITLEADLLSNAFDVVVHVLERAADHGFQIMLSVTGPGAVHMTARAARSQDTRGILFVGLRDLDVAGTFLRDDDQPRLEKLLREAASSGVLWAEDLNLELRTMGYRAQLWPSAAASLSLHVEPGRLIRRIRIRGHIPLQRRLLQRELSLSARPGAIARGVCESPDKLRNRPRPEMCPAEDLTCQEWVTHEKERVTRYLFDEGFLQATVDFGLSCGRAPDEADLWMFLDKGPAYRLPKRRIKVVGNVGSGDARWIRRRFRPTVGPILPIPKRVTRKHIEDARDRVAREYAAPGGTFGAGSRRELQYPYPGVRVETSFDELTPGQQLPPPRQFRLTVDVQLGQGVKTQFLGNSVSEGRLLDQIQLFKRREPVTEAAAVREAENLRAYYQARGNLLATVRGRTPDFGGTGLRQLLFVIEEGPRVQIRRIRFNSPAGVPKQVATRLERAYNKERELKRSGRFTEADARKDLAALLKVYREAGYLCARPRIKIAFWRDGLDQPGTHAVLGLDTPLGTPGEPTWLQTQFDPAGYEALRKKRRLGVHVEIDIDPGPRVLTSGQETVRHLEQRIPVSGSVDGVPLRGSGAWGAPRMLRRSVLRRSGDERSGGIPVRPGLARDAELDVERAYHSSGYPVADASIRWIYRDRQGNVFATDLEERLATEAAGLCRERSGDRVATVGTEVNVYEGKRGTFAGTILRGNFKTRDWLLRREIRWTEGEAYDKRKVDRTLRSIEGTGVAEVVTAQPRPIGCDFEDENAQCRVHETLSMTEAKDYALRPHFGLGGATLDPFYVFVRPVFPNMWGTGWDLTLDGHWGFNPPGLRQAICSNSDCYERSARATLLRQRIWASPLTFSISGNVQQRTTPARGQIDSALTEVRLSWPINRRWQVYVGYLFQIANLSRDLVKPSGDWMGGCGVTGREPCTVVNRREAIVPNRTGALQTGVSWQRVDNPFNPNEGFIATADFLVASPWLGGWDWWFRGDFSWQHFVPIPRTSGRLSIRYSLRYGHAVPFPGGPGAETTSIPDVWRYYGGGTVDLGLRGIEPQTMLLDVERIENQFGVVRLHPRAIGGHIRALGTVAFQVVSLRNLFGGQVSHSLFFDVGILTQSWTQVHFNRDFRRSVGLNFVKWDINIVTLALGYAFLIPNAIWPGNVGPTDDPNGRFVFDVGATF